MAVASPLRRRHYGQVMVDHEDAVRREMNVALYSVRPRREGTRERSARVLRALPRAAAMSDDQRSGHPGGPHSIPDGH